MPLTENTIAQATPQFEQQHKVIKLPRTLLAGTMAMRKAGALYLPEKAAEDEDDYQVRLKRAVLLNMFKRTLNYLAGQVFQKPVHYQEVKDGEAAAAYDVEFFDAFKEDVDAQGTNLSMFSEKLFKDGVTDGIVFLLTDYSQVNIKTTDEGSLLYETQDGQWLPKTAEADQENGWRPYFVLVKANQVLDAWFDVNNGVSELKIFRYSEQRELEKDDGTRETITRVRVFYPDRWEVWEQATEKGNYKKVRSGKNQLGRVPVDWFMPGEQIEGLTAYSALDDLAHMNASHWAAYADHEDLMQFVRRPVWKGTGLVDDENTLLPFGPGRMINAGEGSDLKSVGVDPGSVDKSFTDLKAKEDYMALYGLQLVTQQTGTMTATQAGIAAAASDSTLKDWVELLKDCLENALKKVAQWHGDEDGPAISINNEFRINIDAALLAQLAAMVRDRLLSKETLLETMKLMDMFGDEFTVERELERILNDSASRNTEFPDGFGNLTSNAQQGEGAA